MIVTDIRFQETKWEQILPATKQTPVMVRAMVEQIMRGWGLGGTEVEHAKVIISEMIANAIVHAEMQDVRYRIERYGLRVVIAVWDTSPKDPYLELTDGCDVESECGRGLLIIDALSAKWGIEREGYRRNGKWVWSALDCHVGDECSS